MDPVITLAATSSDADTPTSWLRYWHWLVPRDFEVVCATCLGDAFLRDPHGSIWWLDVGGAELQLVGQPGDSETRLEDPEQVNLWSGRVLREKLEEAGLRLEPRQCYTYLTHPILGGSYEPSNFRVIPLHTHFGAPS